MIPGSKVHQSLDEKFDAAFPCAKHCGSCCALDVHLLLPLRSLPSPLATYTLQHEPTIVTTHPPPPSDLRSSFLVSLLTTDSMSTRQQLPTTARRKLPFSATAVSVRLSAAATAVRPISSAAASVLLSAGRRGQSWDGWCSSGPGYAIF